MQRNILIELPTTTTTTTAKLTVTPTAVTAQQPEAGPDQIFATALQSSKQADATTAEAAYRGPGTGTTSTVSSQTGIEPPPPQQSREPTSGRDEQAKQPETNSPSPGHDSGKTVTAPGEDEEDDDTSSRSETISSDFTTDKGSDGYATATPNEPSGTQVNMYLLVGVGSAVAFIVIVVVVTLCVVRSRKRRAIDKSIHNVNTITIDNKNEACKHPIEVSPGNEYTHHPEAPPVPSSERRVAPKNGGSAGYTYPDGATIPTRQRPTRPSSEPISLPSSGAYDYSYAYQHKQPYPSEGIYIDIIEENESTAATDEDIKYGRVTVKDYEDAKNNADDRSTTESDVHQYDNNIQVDTEN